MSKLIVFENANEVIVGDAASANDIIRDWFLNGKRILDDYDTYLVDGHEGFSFRSKITPGPLKRTAYDVTELMPNALREALIDFGQLTEE
jgi:hypothetical protein